MEALRAILSRPDNIPVLLLVPVLVVLLVAWWRLARAQDRVLEQQGEDALLLQMQGLPEAEEPSSEPAESTVAELPERLHTWPYLVRLELLAALVVLLLLTIWSVLVDAPLEQLANPAVTPDPSKAPWYFVGLQEMLVYFDPWIAGVVLPCLIVFGLCAIPYLDSNPAGNGYYCFKPRRFAISTFLFGFLGLWIALILVGVFCRGPGWQWFWPWQPWDHDLPQVGHTVNLSDLVGIRSTFGATLFGGLAVLGYYGLAAGYWCWRRRSAALRALGGRRYALLAFLLLTMLALPIKIALRLLLAVKYVWVTPWFNV